MEEMSHTVTLCLEVPFVVRIGLYLNGYDLADLQPISLKAYTFHWVIRH